MDLNLNAAQTIGTIIHPAAIPLVVTGESAIGRVRSALTRIEYVLQGNLEAANYNAGFESSIESAHIQRGAVVQTWSAGGTADLDYNRYLFVDQGERFDDTEDVINRESVVGRPAQFERIPGANKTIQLNAAALVRIQWMVAAVADGYDDANAAYLGLFINDDLVPAHVRMLSTCSEITLPRWNVRGYRGMRVWSGVTWRRLAIGEHTVGVGVGSTKAIPNVRVWCRNISVMAFKTADPDFFEGYDE